MYASTGTRSRSTSAKTKKSKTSFKTPTVAIRRLPGPRAGPGTRQIVKMIYATKIAMPAATLGTASTYQFRINSIFDPDLTSIGHQPSTHDQYEVMFETYCVTACRFNLSLMNDDSSPKVGGFYVSDRDDTSSVFDTLIEQGTTEWKVMGGEDGGPACVNFNAYVDICKLMGLSYSQYTSSPSYITTFGSNPSDIAYLNIIATDKSTGSLGNVYGYIELEFTVLLQGTRLIPQS